MIDGVVVAGGRSRRMGSDKALLRWRGQRLVDRVVATLATGGGRVVVASGARPLGVPGADAEVADPPGLTGPLAGMVAGLAVTSAPFVAVVAVDVPDPSWAVLERLVDLCRRAGRSAAVPVVGGTPQPLHSVVARPAVAALTGRARAGEASPRRALGWLDALLVGPDGWCDADPGAAFAADWDRPEDLPRGVAR